MQTIMVATDFSERSERALRRAILLARQFGASITLVHVVDDDQPRRIVESEFEAASRLLDELSGTLADVDGVRCDGQLIVAAPFVGIDQATRDRAPDLLVIGSHRRQVLRDIFIGTTAERTIRSVSCPVLMVNSPPVGPYRNVLLTTDLSDNSRSAIERFASLGIAGRARTEVVYVFEARALGPAMSHTMPKDDKEHRLQGEREDAALQLSQFMSGYDLEVAEQIARHDTSGPANEILTVAKNTQAGLIVIGTQGKSGLARLLLGSVAEEVLRSTTTDVLAVPPNHDQ
ncbi:universal stress protein [Amorphus sp. 3PC139-8]|uniref:universal stress protein n=1 Tax=Amorphus sp. 3PC139-8 TaxID=2735676 RepID=UPI00345C9EDB